MSNLHQKLMDTAYERWNAKWNKEEFHDSLDAQERFAVHTGNFCYQVQNGGFMQWWDNRYGTPSTVEYLIRAMERMNTPTAKTVGDMLQVFKESMRQRDPRTNIDEDEWEEMRSELDGLDTDFYKIDDQFLADCEAHLQKGGW